MNSTDSPFLAVQIENRVVIYKLNITETTQEKVRYAANDVTVIRKYSLQIYASARCDYGKISWFVLILLYFREYLLFR